MSSSSFAQGIDQLGGGTGKPRGSRSELLAAETQEFIWASTPAGRGNRDWRENGARSTVSIRPLWVSSDIDTGLEAIEHRFEAILHVKKLTTCIKLVKLQQYKDIKNVTL